MSAGRVLSKGVILSAAVFQAERRISRATIKVPGKLHARSLTRLKRAGFRDDASKKVQISKLHAAGDLR
jgi:hypothetical protein